MPGARSRSYPGLDSRLFFRLLRSYDGRLASRLKGAPIDGMRVVGEGSFSLVCKFRDPSLGGLCVKLVLLPTDDDDADDVYEQAFREAKNLAALHAQSPEHFPACHAFGTAINSDERLKAWAIAMDDVTTEGYVTLKGLAGRAYPLGAPEVASACIPIVQAVTDMHDAGIASKDLSWGNVMVKPGNRAVKLIDMGQANERGRFDATVRERRHLGTRGFSAPEVLGETLADCNEYNYAYRAEPSVDIFSLGALAFLLWTGTSAEYEDGYALGIAPDLPDRCVDEIDKEPEAWRLLCLIDWCMQYNPRYRPLEGEVATMLGEMASGKFGGLASPPKVTRAEYLCEVAVSMLQGTLREGDFGYEPGGRGSYEPLGSRYRHVAALLMGAAEMGDAAASESLAAVAGAELAEIRRGRDGRGCARGHQ